MSRAVVRAGRDSWVNENKPAKNLASAGRIRVRADSGSGTALRSFIWLKNPVPDGATVLSATLRLVQWDTITGSVTLDAKRTSDSWKVRRLNWTNQPGVVGAAASVTKSGTGRGEVWEFDVTNFVQRWADGAPNYGFRITSNSTEDVVFYALNANVNKPRLIVEYSDAPAAPSLLKPDSGVVSVAKPVLRCDYTDLSGSTELAAIQVQIDAAQDGAAADFDSGEVATDEPELDLADTAYAGLADGASTFWRVRLKDGDGLWSDWSDWATLARDAKGALTLTNPAADPSNFVSEYTPPIAWTLTGETQTHYQVRILDANRPKTILYDSGKIKSAETSHTIPRTSEGRRILKDDRTYIVVVRVWDSKNREATPGDPAFTAVRREFSVAFDATVNMPDSLTAAQVPHTPFVDLTWTRSTMPDSWTINRNGEAIATDLDPADVFVSGTTYTWRDWTGKPGQSHMYRVRAEVNGKVSAGSTPSATIQLTPSTIILGDPTNEKFVVLVGNAPGSMAYGEDSRQFLPLGASRPIRVVAGMRGLEGSMVGELMSFDEFDMDVMENDLWDIKSRPADEFQLMFGDVSIPVVLSNITIRPLPGNGEVKHVSFDFIQTGDLPFDPEL